MEFQFNSKIKVPVLIVHAESCALTHSFRRILNSRMIRITFLVLSFGFFSLRFLTTLYFLATAFGAAAAAAGFLVGA